MRFWTFLKALFILYLCTNLLKDILKTRGDIVSQRLDTVYNILDIYIYVHGQMSWTLQSPCPWTGQSWTSRPWTLSRPITSTAPMYSTPKILLNIRILLRTVIKNIIS